MIGPIRRIAVVLSAGAILLVGGDAGRAQVKKVELVASTEALTPDKERLALHLPPGFEIQLVASDPDIQKPMNIAFDARGRLWVTDTIEYPFPAKEGTKPRDTVKVLEDFDENGKARKITTFADGLNIPIGLLPTHDGVIVHGIPDVHLITDTDGDGKGDKREVLFGKIGFRDTHGMTSAFTHAFDGWVYACHGFSNQSELVDRGGGKTAMQSGNTYRFRPDGSKIEQWTWGQVNPFGLSLDPLFNLYSSDCHTKPVYMLLRGAYYPSFGKPADGLGFGPEICAHLHGSTGIAGVSHYAADQFPPEFRDNLFVGNPVTSRVNRDTAARSGSTLRMVEQPDFIVSDDPWFRPVDIKLGPDGALYIADFYNRIIGHYEVPLTHPGRDRHRGRIWRVVYKGAGAKAPAPLRDFTKTATAELAQLLADANLTVRLFATHELARRGGESSAAVRPMLKSPVAVARVHAMWTLHRLGALEDAALLECAGDTDAAVRTHAMRLIGERSKVDDALRARAVAGLKDADGFVQRSAADTLGRHPAPANVRPLLDLRLNASRDDVQLIHTVRMALRDQIAAAGDSLAGWGVKIDELQSNDRDARGIADVLIGTNSAAAAEALLSHLTRYGEGSEVTARFAGRIARFGSDKTLADLLAWGRKLPEKDVDREALLLKTLHQGLQERGGGKTELVRAWADDLSTRLLGSTAANRVIIGCDLVASLKLSDRHDAAAAIADDRKRSLDQRQAAMGAVAALKPAASIPRLATMLADPSEDAGLREAAANVLGGLNQPAARAELVKAFKLVPARLETTVAAALASNAAGAEELLQAVAAGKASPRLLQERSVTVKLQASRLGFWVQRVAALTKGLPPADVKVAQLIAARRKLLDSTPGDAKLGEAVFTKFCAGCHQVAGKGNKVGPQLDGVGIRGADRVLEDVIDSNRNVDQAFRTTVLALTDDRIVTGLLLREEGQVVVLADQQGKEVRVEKGNIAKRELSPLSPMPANFAEQISEADFRHLVAFLLAQRVVEPKK